MVIQIFLISKLLTVTWGNFVLDQSAHLFTFWPLSQSECVNRGFCKQHIGGYALGLLPLDFLYFTTKSKYVVRKEFFLNFTVAICYLWPIRKDIDLQTLACRSPNILH